MSEDRPFLDTNVLVYAYSRNASKMHEVGARLLESDSFCISTQVINEFIWVMARKAKVPIEDITTIVRNLYLKVPVIETGMAVILKSLGISAKYGFAHWDSLIISAALVAGCPILYSEDMQDGQTIEGLQIVNPFKD